jgi:(E)-4-hydroxy-3-methylbut-2-enyl-diphosphate synthase
VGKQAGYISLYRGRDEIRKVPEAQGVEELLNLIKSDGQWIEPEI